MEGLRHSPKPFRITSHIEATHTHSTGKCPNTTQPQRHTSKLGKSFGGTFKMKAHTTHSKGTPTEAHQTTSAHTTGSPARNIPQPAPVPQNHSAPTPECPNTRMPQHHSAKPPTPQCPMQQHHSAPTPQCRPPNTTMPQHHNAPNTTRPQCPNTRKFPQHNRPTYAVTPHSSRVFWQSLSCLLQRREWPRRT